VIVLEREMPETRSQISRLDSSSEHVIVEAFISKIKLQD